MIAASEPLEFIPRGRQAVNEHPGPLISKHQVNTINDNLLLYRLQNVNISADEHSTTEFWSVYEIYKDNDEVEQELTASSDALSNDDSVASILKDSVVNAEHELYVKGNTAVWTKGIYDEKRNELPQICFTCDTPIQHAFFCSSNFIKNENPDMRRTPANDDGPAIDFGICLIDSHALRVYLPSGEDYVTSLEFTISHVWSTNQCILLQRNITKMSLDSSPIQLPRLFSLTHPLSEMLPVLFRTLNGNISFFMDDYRIIFASNEHNLVLLYDNKSGRHLVAVLRKATAEEKQSVEGTEENDPIASSLNISNFSSIHANLSQSSSFKCDNNDSKARNLSILTKSGIAPNAAYSPFSSSRQHSITANSYLLPNLISSPNRTQIQSPYDRLQNSFMGTSQSAYAEQVRKLAEVQPSKPIAPDMCLEHIWTENVINKDYVETASHGFIHTDLIGQLYMCYLLPRTGNLLLTRLEKSNSKHGTPIFGMAANIPAKDAALLPKLKMIAVLAPCGALILYTGPNMIGKVHIAGVLSNIPLHLNATSFGPSSFPRRSSLLPTVQTEAKFEDELHLLSPVHPLQPQFSSRTNYCGGLRDAAANRLTLTYPDGKMYRISIPLISECPFVTKCLRAMKHVLKKELAIALISKWYGARNAPGAQDLSAEKEWQAFQAILLEMLGRPLVYDVDQHSIFSQSSFSISSDEPKKRRKFDSCQGDDTDWQFLLDHFNGHVEKPYVSHDDSAATTNEPSTSAYKNDPNAILFPSIPLVFFTMHLLYEEMKIDSTLRHQMKSLAKFLNYLATDLHLDSYTLHYFLDFPELAYTNSTSYIAESDMRKFVQGHFLNASVPNVFRTINEILKGNKIEPYPCIAGVNQWSKHMVQLVALIINDDMDSCINVINLFPASQSPPTNGIANDDGEHRKKKSGGRVVTKLVSHEERLSEALLSMNITREDIGRLPLALHYLLAEVLERSRLCPPMDCDPRLFELIYRPDLYANTMLETEKEKITYKNFKNENSLCPRVQPKSESMSMQTLNEDGMSQIHTKLFRLRFPTDSRIDEVRRLLTSANPVIIDITQQVGVSDHEFIEEKEKQLFAMCTRTMALPLGRGMFTLRTLTPAATESLNIPKLCLSGKEKQKGAAIEMQQIEVPQNMNVWPMFHNGVAAGLQLTPDCKDVDSTWIVYNKPKGQQEGATEHSGFLMALGLNGHLKSLSFISIYEYLVKCDEMTSLGLILGISAAHRGTMDTTTTKLLSVHIEALLPATALELDIPQNIQVAAVMGIGLIYQGTAKRHIAEVLLQEIGRPPGPEMENCVERESYALTAGLALGMVTLGKGESPPGLKDLQLPDTLHYYMIGGNRRPLTGSQKEKYKLPSFQVREGDTVNIDVTAPGATLALGLMFFATKNEAVAHWMKPPDTNYLLDLVRPDLLLLRILARGLILWDDIGSSNEWLQSQFPESLRFDLKYGPKDLENSNMDHEANCQAYCNIITGGALCIGLRYAGTDNLEAFATLKKTFDLFHNMNGWYVGEYSGKATVESCLILILIAMSLVKAGSGDVNILRTCRMLRTRLGPSNAQVTYGSHMAIHMALGFQFLGAGRFTLSRSPQAIAALVCALFPKFPTHSNDNRYHLQAFRHFYVLAIEPRMLLPRDIDSGKLCLCNIQYTTIDDRTLSKMAPCMLPDLDSLKKVCFTDSNYWSITYEKGKNWNQLDRVLSRSGCIDIKQKAGCMSHLDDPTRLHSLFAQTLTSEQFSCWKTHTSNLLIFSNETKVRDFIAKFLPSSATADEQTPEQLKIVQLLSLQFYHCLIKDTMHALSIHIDMLTAYQDLSQTPSNYEIWQFRIIETIVEKKIGIHLLLVEHLTSLLKMVRTRMDTILTSHLAHLKRYLFSSNVTYLQEIGDIGALKEIAATINYYDLPINVMNLIDLGGGSGQPNIMRFFIEMKKLNFNPKSIQCICDILKTNA